MAKIENITYETLRSHDDAFVNDRPDVSIAALSNLPSTAEGQAAN
jgi:hypothetical protein